jgi:hypothetical protein
MSVARDIVATWRRPRQVMRRLLAQGRREDRAIMLLLLACGIIFVSQWPGISREAALNADGAPLQARLAITFFAWLMIWPLLFYGLGSLTHVIARLFGGKGTYYSARLALFWALLASTPAWLFYGLVTGFIGPGPAQTLVGAGLLLAFLSIWGICLREAEISPEAEATA